MTKLFVFALIAGLSWFSVKRLDPVNVPVTEVFAASDEAEARSKRDRVESVKAIPVQFRIRTARHWYVESNERRNVWHNRKEEAKVMHSFDDLTKELESIYRSNADSETLIIERSHVVREETNRERKGKWKV